MTAPEPLPFTCQTAAIDGEPALSLHQERCTICGPDTLFDLPAEPERGGQHL